MTQLVLDDLDPQILESLKARATKHNRSLENELKAILQEVIEAEKAEHLAKMATFREQAAHIRQTLSGRIHPDSSELVREDRTR